MRFPVTITGRYEVIFGDYERDVVRDEQDEHREDYKNLKIYRLTNDRQKTINAKIKQLNKELDENSDPILNLNITLEDLELKESNSSNRFWANLTGIGPGSTRNQLINRHGFKLLKPAPRKSKTQLIDGSTGKKITFMFENKNPDKTFSQMSAILADLAYKAAYHNIGISSWRIKEYDRKNGSFIFKKPNNEHVIQVILHELDKQDGS